MLAGHPPAPAAVLPLREQWAAACDALAAGKAGEALQRFAEFDQWYGGEPEVADAGFREGWIRLWGLAALQAGALDQGVRLLEQWFTENPDQPRFRAFIRFQLAAAANALGDAERATRHWGAFTGEHPDLPECLLVRWMWAELCLREGDRPRAREHLATILESASLPSEGRGLARAALALVELVDDRTAEAFNLLSDRSGAAAGAGLGLWRALLAPSLSRSLIESGQIPEALEAAMWFDTAAGVNARMEALARTAGGAPSAAANRLRRAIWDQHWDSQYKRLQAAVAEQGKGAGGGAAPLYALRLQALLKGGRPLPARVLAGALLESAGPLADELRSTAYATAIEARQQLGEWTEAEGLAQRFQQDFPDHPELPRILFLQARTAAGRKDYATACRIAAGLAAAYPQHAHLLSWEASSAGWLLQAGKPEEALARLTDLVARAPVQWHAHLRFQQAACIEKLNRLAEAKELLSQLMQDKSATAALLEQAQAALLRIFLRTGDDAAFSRALARYRAEFADGMSAPLVENMAGSWHQRAGRAAEAAATWQRVADGGSPFAGFAHARLSELYRQSNDMDGLRTHALGWIGQCLADAAPLPPEPLEDCLAWQRATTGAALPGALLQDILDALDSGSRDLPAFAILDVVAACWPAYRAMLPDGSGSPERWLEERARARQREGRLAAYAAYALQAARLLERAGRQDPADARRIQVLQTAGREELGEDARHALALTAHRYDFPEAAGLLAAFLDAYPASPRRPELLYLLAGLRRVSPAPQSALPLLEEVWHSWPDCAVHADAGLRLAGWLLDDGRPADAHGVLTRLLDRPGLPPLTTANALYLRARADLAAGEPGRARLACERILTLYPAFHDISEAARSLLDECA